MEYSVIQVYTFVVSDSMHAKLLHADAAEETVYMDSEYTTVL